VTRYCRALPNYSEPEFIEGASRRPKCSWSRGHDNQGPLLIQRDRDVDDGLVEPAQRERLARRETEGVEPVPAVHRERREREVGHRHAIHEQAVDIEAGRGSGLNAEFPGRNQGSGVSGRSRRARHEDRGLQR
jgi:hypothetical protein